MYNAYLYEKLIQTRHQEILHAAEQRRLLAQLPQREPHLMRNVATRLAGFLMSLPFTTKKAMQPVRRVTSQL